MVDLGRGEVVGVVGRRWGGNENRKGKKRMLGLSHVGEMVGGANSATDSTFTRANTNILVA